MRALALALAAVAGLTACGGSSGGQPQTLPPVTTSPAAAVSPTPAPTGKDAPTPEGAAAFARFVYSQIEQGFAVRDPSLVEAVSESGCSSCRNFIESIKSVAKGNQRVQGFHITVTTAVAPATTATTARVDVVRNSTGGTFVGPDGKIIAREPPLRGIEERMDLVRGDNGWRVAQIVRVRVRG